MSINRVSVENHLTDVTLDSVSMTYEITEEPQYVEYVFRPPVTVGAELPWMSVAYAKASEHGFKSPCFENVRKEIITIEQIETNDGNMMEYTMLVVDEEGFLKQLPPVRIGNYMFYGTVLLTRFKETYDEDGGECTQESPLDVKPATLASLAATVNHMFGV